MDLLSESGWVWSSRRFRRENTCHCHNHRWDSSPFFHHKLAVDLRVLKICQTTGMLCVWGKKTLELKERQQLGGGGAQSVKVSNHFFLHGGKSCVLQVLRDQILVAVSEYILILDNSCQVSFSPPSLFWFSQEVFRLKQYGSGALSCVASDGHWVVAGASRSGISNHKEQVTVPKNTL